MRTLIAIVGAGDPYRAGLVEGLETRGPILSAVAATSFDRVHLLATTGCEPRCEATQQVLRGRWPALEVDSVLLAVEGSDAGALAEALEAFLRSGRGDELLCAGPCFALLCAGPSSAPVAWLLAALRLPAPPVLLDFAESSTPLEGPRQLIEISLPSRVGKAARPGGGGIAREPVAEYGRRRAAATADDEDPLVLARRLGIRGEHPHLRRAVETAVAVGRHDVPVLIEGETGTGKSLFARLVHAAGGRRAEIFLGVNCGALPEKLVESTLFGHRKGAFTGAASDQPGKFEVADGGTLFLDEIGEMPLELQPKLLRVLDDGMIEPVGARVGQRVNVRIVAATNRDLRAAVRAGRFREDLYYRIAFGLVRVPPLRERPEDIPLLAAHFLDRYNAALRRPRRFAPETLLHLQRQPWCGNVRELENTIGRSVLLSGDTEVLAPGDLGLEAAEDASGRRAFLPEPHDAFSLEGFLSETRRALMRRALELTGGNQAAAARKLGITPQAVHKFLRSERGRV